LGAKVNNLCVDSETSRIHNRVNEITRNSVTITTLCNPLFKVLLKLILSLAVIKLSNSTSYLFVLMQTNGGDDSFSDLLMHALSGRDRRTPSAANSQND